MDIIPDSTELEVPGSATLRALFVSEAYRHRGIGSAIFSGFKNECVKRGVVVVQLTALVGNQHVEDFLSQIPHRKPPTTTYQVSLAEAPRGVADAGDPIKLLQYDQAGPVGKNPR